MDLSCFKAYDIRGEVGVNFDTEICYWVGLAMVQLLDARQIILGRDARGTSREFADAVAHGVIDAGADVLDIGLSGTEEVYWSVSEFNACGGIMVTASHNPITYNGLKIVKSGSRPLEPSGEFLDLHKLVKSRSRKPLASSGTRRNMYKTARAAYIDKVISFIEPSALKPLKIVVNSGNGAAGPTIDAIAAELSRRDALLHLIQINHEPDPAFPNGIPNPMLAENHADMAEIILREGADFGVSFDGDFDRCAIFDDLGRYISGEYLVGLLAELMLHRHPASSVVYEPRVTWNIEDAISSAGGIGAVSKIGHAFLKSAMRGSGAVYGGELSCHHYFRDFAYCDSGMIPWLLVAEHLSQDGEKISDYVNTRRTKFLSSGERNFSMGSPGEAFLRVTNHFASDLISLDETDGLSLIFNDWRLNLRCANTEPLVRLNLETRGDSRLLAKKLAEVTTILKDCP